MWPHLVIVTDRVPDGFAGVTNGPLIRIRPTHRDDRGLLAHELEHVRQFWLLGIFGMAVLAVAALAGLPWGLAPAGLVLHPLLYRFGPHYRLWAELQAYQQQLAQPGRLTIEQAADFIATKYRLDVSPSEALSLIKKEL